LTVHRLLKFCLCALCAGVLAWAPSAHAAAQVSKLSLVLSGSASTITAKDFNEHVIDRFNTQVLEPRGIENIKKITFGWLYDAEFRYFVRPNFTAQFGVGQLKSISRRDVQPAIGMSLGYSAELLSVPVHLGGSFYLPPYNSGDFQARWFVGGGMTSLVYNRAKFNAVETNVDSLRATPVGNVKLRARRDAPGYYFETGVHMFFGGRYSVMLAGNYRSSLVRQALGSVSIHPRNTPETVTPVVLDIDTSGYGGKVALAIGF